MIDPSSLEVPAFLLWSLESGPLWLYIHYERDFFFRFAGQREWWIINFSLPFAQDGRFCPRIYSLSRGSRTRR